MTERREVIEREKDKGSILIRPMCIAYTAQKEKYTRKGGEFP
jgi:hypothetical protein